MGPSQVRWLVKEGYAADVNEALAIGNGIHDLGLLEHVTKDHKFKNCHLFYRFSLDCMSETATVDSEAKADSANRAAIKCDPGPRPPACLLLPHHELRPGSLATQPTPPPLLSSHAKCREQADMVFLHAAHIHKLQRRLSDVSSDVELLQFSISALVEAAGPNQRLFPSGTPNFTSCQSEWQRARLPFPPDAAPLLLWLVVSVLSFAFLCTLVGSPPPPLIVTCRL